MSVIDDSLCAYFKKYPIQQKSVIGVAVSGGLDSLCLSYHLAAYAQKNNLILKAVTVDHALRPESSEEAQKVHHDMTQWGIEHTILRWTGKKPTTRIEEKARQKRYDLMQKWCLENNIRHLFLAHHLGDQVETFWLRLSHTSGLDGLSCMDECTLQNGIYLCRPFLKLSKSLFEKDFHSRHISWCEDTMNQNETFERVRWRHRQKELSDWGLTPKSIEKTSARLRRARQALDFYADRFISALVDISPKGYISVQEQAFLSLPEEIRLRVLKKSIRIVYHSKIPLSLETLEKWLMEFPRKATFAGCILVRQKGILFIARESFRMETKKTIPANKKTNWDRFTILSPCTVQIAAGSNDSELPLLVRQSVPSIQSSCPVQTIFMTGTKKELEKKFAFDYNKKDFETVIIMFKGIE